MYEYNYDELYHYGVKGMRWGVRRARKMQNKAQLARDSAKEWDELSRAAKNSGNAKRAAKYKKNAADDRRDAKRYDSKAKAATKEVNRTKSAIKDYRKKFDDAEKASNIADQKWDAAMDQYRSLGKTRVTRILNAARNKSAAAQKYSKMYDDATTARELADVKWNEAKRSYVNTGRNTIERILNNIEYDKRH